jgi:hypothetical protein
MESTSDCSHIMDSYSFSKMHRKKNISNLIRSNHELKNNNFFKKFTSKIFNNQLIVSFAFSLNFDIVL